MPKRWRNRTYTYSEPVDSSEYEPQPHGITGPDTYDDPSAIRAGDRAEYDAGFDAGYRLGWTKGYAKASGHGDEALKETLEQKEEA